MPQPLLARLERHIQLIHQSRVHVPESVIPTTLNSPGIELRADPELDKDRVECPLDEVIHRVGLPFGVLVDTSYLRILVAT